MSDTATPTQNNKIDIARVSDYLSRRFREVPEKLPRAARTENGPNNSYSLQQEFCYRLDEIQRGPAYQVPKLIQQMTGWLASLAK